MGALVPAYFYPINGGVGGDWGQLYSAASQIPVTAIFNPASGPGTSSNSDYVAALTTLEADGGKAVAYVPTYYAGTLDPVHGALSYVEGEIQSYINFYPNQVHGFFIDQMTNDNSASDLAYYNTLYTYIKGLSTSYQVIGNPGTNTVEDYLKPITQGADTLVTYENVASLYAGTSPPSWVTGYSPDHFANIIHTESSVQGMMSDIALAAQRNVGYVYVTDLKDDASDNFNPYTALPSYWDQEVAAIQSVPEPGTLTMLATGGLLVTLGITMRRRLGA